MNILKTTLTHSQRNANRQTGGFQTASKLLWSNSWIAQIGTSRSEGATTEGAAADTWNSQLMAAGGSQVPATGNDGNWNAVVGVLPNTSYGTSQALLLYHVVHFPRCTIHTH